MGSWCLPASCPQPTPSSLVATPLSTVLSLSHEHGHCRAFFWGSILAVWGTAGTVLSIKRGLGVERPEDVSPVRLQYCSVMTVARVASLRVSYSACKPCSVTTRIMQHSSACESDCSSAARVQGPVYLRWRAAHNACLPACQRLLQQRGASLLAWHYTAVIVLHLRHPLITSQAIAAIVAPISSALRQTGERVRIAIQSSSLVGPSAAARGAEPPEYIRRMRAMFQ